MDTPNLSYINELSGGDETFKNKLITIVKNEFPEEKAQYYYHLKTKNYSILAENVHKIKHKISILGLESSYRLAETYENNLKNNSLTGYDAFEEILKKITDYLETL